MEIEKWDGTKEKRFYDTLNEMLEDAEREAKKPTTKKLTLYMPKRTIPQKRKKRKR